MPLSLMLTWWNLIYIVPFLLGVVYLGLFVFTGITFGDADADVDADADIDADADVDAPVHVEAHVGDFDADADADLDADHDIDGQAAAPHGAAAIMPHTGLDHSIDAAGHLHPLMSFLSLLGVGKIPLSLALMILMFCWGLVGFSLNALLFSWLGPTSMIGFLTAPVTVVASLALTGLCAAAVAKIIPNDDSARQRRQDFVGKSGEAIYDIDENFGMASVRGNAGDFFQIPCRTREPATRIAKGSRIVIFDYDRDRGIFHVAPYEP